MITGTGARLQGKGRAVKIVSLKFSVQFTEDGYDPEYEAEFDTDALEDGLGEALLLYENDQWGCTPQGRTAAAFTGPIRAWPTRSGGHGSS
jgi:hypothetical protein